MSMDATIEANRKAMDDDDEADEKSWDDRKMQLRSFIKRNASEIDDFLSE